MKKFFILPLAAFSALSFASCHNQPQPVQLTLISEWGSFSEEYPTPRMVINAVKSQKFKDVKGITEPSSFFPEVLKFCGWAFDAQGTKVVPEDYVIEGNTTIYANYHRETDYPEKSYIVYAYNSSARAAEENRNVVEFKYKKEAALSATDIKVKNTEREFVQGNDGDYNVEIDPTQSDVDYKDIVITFNETKLGAFTGSVVIEIEKPIDDLRLSPGYLKSLYAPGNAYVTAILLGNGATTISDYAFNGCDWLMAISLPDSVTSIGAGAFNLCYSLNSFEASKELTTIGVEAFYGCATMEHIYLNDKLTTIKPRAFFGCASLKEIHIPDSVTDLGYEAFRFCLLNNDLKIGSGISIIPNHCFSENYYLQKVTIPNTVNQFGTACFQFCDSLEEINFEDGGESITDPLKIDCSFQYCISLAKVKIPNRFKTLGKQTFAHTMLYELDLSAITDKAIEFGINSITEDCPLSYGYGKIAVPSNLEAQYKNAEGWKRFQGVIVGQ